MGGGAAIETPTLGCIGATHKPELFPGIRSIRGRHDALGTAFAHQSEPGAEDERR